MMHAKAYVLIEAEAGQMPEVIMALRRVPSVRAVDATTGPYDVIAAIETADQAALGRLVMDTLQQIGGIKRTITCVVIG